MMLYGVMYSYQSLKKRECFKMKMFYIFLILISVNFMAAAICALLSHKTNQPIKLRLDRDDDIILTGKRHDFYSEYEVGFNDKGKIEGLKLKIASMIQEGKTDQEIKDYVTSRFGKESLYEPEFNNSTYILWLAPFVVLFLALFIFISRKKT